MQHHVAGTEGFIYLFIFNFTYEESLSLCVVNSIYKKLNDF